MDYFQMLTRGYRLPIHPISLKTMEAHIVHMQ